MDDGWRMMEKEIISKSPGYVIDNKSHVLWCDKCNITNVPVVHIDLKVKTKINFTQKWSSYLISNKVKEIIDGSIEWLCGQCFTEEFPKVNHSALKNFNNIKI